MHEVTSFWQKCQLQWCVASERALLWSHPDVGGLEVEKNDSPLGLSYPIRAPASPRISMPPKLGLRIARSIELCVTSVTHTHAQHMRVVFCPPRARRECLGSALASPPHMDKLSLASAFDIVCLTLQMRLRVSKPP